MEEHEDDNLPTVDMRPFFFLTFLIVATVAAFGSVLLFLWWGGVWGLCTGVLLAMGCYGCGRHFEGVHKYMVVKRIHEGGPKL